MLDWIKRRRPTSLTTQAATGKPRARVMSGQYLLLHKYLENRYADTVVLTLAQIEDLLGFPLPEEARLQREWWTDPAAGANHADAWLLASRTAVPDLKAKTVMFERGH